MTDGENGRLERTFTTRRADSIWTGIRNSEINRLSWWAELAEMEQSLRAEERVRLW